jgi:nicotinamide mononucleotide adenylyltransferase
VDDVGVIHGRFQVFHNDHLRYVLAGKSLCNHIVVGITNPDPMLTRDDAADPHRSDPAANPLTYFERYTIVRSVLLEAALAHRDFSIVPFPINFPDLYRYYLPMNATFYLTIYDEWGRRKLDQFKSMGLRTHLLWMRPLSEKGLSASDVRRRMAFGEHWEDMVPAAAASLLNAWKVPERLARSHLLEQSG